MLNRRGFLSSAIAAVSALAVDPERLLWVPGAKKIFVPTTTVQSASMLTRDSLELLRMNLVFAKYHGEFTTGPMKIGAVITVRRPPKYSAMPLDKSIPFQ